MTAPLPQRRRSGWVAAGVVGSLAVGAAAVFGVQAAVTPPTVMGQASPAPGASAPADFLPGHRRGGPGSRSGGSGGSPSSGSMTAATAAQQVGIVEIDTVLRYQGARAAGTGMVLTPDGEILTNDHVVDGATSFKGTVAGAAYTASVVGTDPTDDVAVLQLVHASGLRTAMLSTTVATVGEAVTGVGNAGGTGTLTAVPGTVIALDRSITATDETGADPEQLTGLIESDAAVQAGDSGGPLYGDDGKVIGMDTAASSGGPADAYAIPIGTAAALAAQIESGANGATIHHGTRAFLGVSVTDGADGATVARCCPAARPRRPVRPRATSSPRWAAPPSPRPVTSVRRCSATGRVTACGSRGRTRTGRPTRPRSPSGPGRRTDPDSGPAAAAPLARSGGGGLLACRRVR